MKFFKEKVTINVRCHAPILKFGMWVVSPKKYFDLKII